MRYRRRGAKHERGFGGWRKRADGKWCMTRLYYAWRNMCLRTDQDVPYILADHKKRCYKQCTMCKEWRLSFAAFKAWAHKAGYRNWLTIDRIDSNKGYGPDNCRWVDKYIQARNHARYLRVHPDWPNTIEGKIGVRHETVFRLASRLRIAREDVEAWRAHMDKYGWHDAEGLPISRGNFVNALVWFATCVPGREDLNHEMTRKGVSLSHFVSPTAQP